MLIQILGAGSGREECLSLAARQAILEADVLLGSPRVLSALGHLTSARQIPAISNLAAQLDDLDCDRVAVLFSGDCGFWSGARFLIDQLKKRQEEEEAERQEKLRLQEEEAQEDEPDQEVQEPEEPVDADPEDRDPAEEAPPEEDADPEPEEEPAPDAVDDDVNFLEIYLKGDPEPEAEEPIEEDYEDRLVIEILPGLSSVQMLAARLGRPWQDWLLVSAHGASCDPIQAVMSGKPVFFLTSGSDGPTELCKELVAAGLGSLAVTVGENLFRPEERVISLTAAEVAEQTFEPINVMLTEAVPVMPRRSSGWPDSVFVRGNPPMTKQMVRAAALASLAITPEDVVWDVGAGTGSVSVELAALARRVYAVERDPDACALIRANREKFRAWNLTLREGEAPKDLFGLPAPDAAFIGGSGGQLHAILEAVLQRNPDVRLCITCVTLETLQTAIPLLQARGIDPKVTQIAITETVPAGNLHRLQAQNPVFLISGSRLCSE